MKQKVRKGLFETNSSSTHSIVIGNNGEDIYANLPEEVYFGGGEFGWEHEEYRDTQSKADYLYTVIVKQDLLEAIPYITETLKKWGVNAKFQELEDKTSWNGAYTYKDFSNFCYVDHSYEAKELVEDILKDEALLMNYLFSDGSFIETGNDNDDTEFTAKYPQNVLLDYYKGN